MKFTDSDSLFEHLDELEEVFKDNDNYNFQHTISISQDGYYLETNITKICQKL